MALPQVRPSRAERPFKTLAHWPQRVAAWRGAVPDRRARVTTDLYRSEEQLARPVGAGEGVRTRDTQLGKPEAVPRWFTAGSPIPAPSARAGDRCLERKLLHVIDLDTAGDAHVRVDLVLRGTSGQSSLRLRAEAR